MNSLYDFTYFPLGLRSTTYQGEGWTILAVYMQQRQHISIQTKPKWELMWYTWGRFSLEQDLPPMVRGFLLHTPSVPFKYSPLILAKYLARSLGKSLAALQFLLQNTPCNTVGKLDEE